jgi:DNA-binding transcriptional LysR family regulator
MPSCERLCFLPEHTWQAYSQAQWNCVICATSLRWRRWKTSVSRGATQKLHVAQPSLSRQIRDLENEVGVQLLERTAKSVRLTDAGRAFLEEARAILKHADEAVVKVRSIAGKLETELRVGDWPLGTGRIMPALLARIRKRCRTRT